MIVLGDEKMSRDREQNQETSRKSTRTRLPFLIPVMAVTVLAGWFAGLFATVANTGWITVPQKADCIIVLGAAVWDGRPSPALYDRLMGAIRYYHGGYAENIICSGGLGRNAPTEAEVMKNFLVSRGVPENKIYLEQRSHSTEENLRFSHEIMKEKGFRTALVVTHNYHIYRALWLAESLGIQAHGGPVPVGEFYWKIAGQQISGSWYYWFLGALREVAALAVVFSRSAVGCFFIDRLIREVYW